MSEWLCASLVTLVSLSRVVTGGVICYLTDCARFIMLSTSGVAFV